MKVRNMQEKSGRMTWESQQGSQKTVQGAAGFLYRLHKWSQKLVANFDNHWASRKMFQKRNKESSKGGLGQHFSTNHYKSLAHHPVQNLSMSCIHQLLSSNPR
jgi:hypothetical protein